MDTRWLEDFLTLSEVGNFTRAAELRHVSQAAFSRRIQSLENWLGAKLIDRSQYPLVLTPDGDAFRQKAESIVTEIAAARVVCPAHREQQVVRVALPYTLAASRLPGWWKTWAGNEPLVCQTRVGTILETTESFATGAADILITYYQPTQRLPLGSMEFERVTLLSETVEPYCSEKLRRRGRFVFPGTEECPVPYFGYTSDAYFSGIVKDILENARHRFHGMLLGESGMSEVLTNFVAEGLGVAWLSDSCLQHRSTRGLTRLDNAGAWSAALDVVAFVAKARLSGHVSRIWQRIKIYSDNV